MEIEITIKGDVFQARAALDARGLLTTRALLPYTNGARPSVKAWVHGTDEAAVARWFCEPAEIVKGEGYPPGTCLLYRVE